MGSRAWGAERRFPDDVGKERVYDRFGDSAPRLPLAVAEKAEELGWDEIWQLTYCQKCAGYAHESEPWMNDAYWEYPELGDARQIWGPSARSVFSLVDKDEAAWVIDDEYKYPVIGLYETRLIGWWAHDDGGLADFQNIQVPKEWHLDGNGQVGTNYTMTPSERARADAFWRSGSSEDVRTMLKLNSAVIQIPFLTRGPFARFRDALYADRDKPADTDRWADALTRIQYEGPLYQFWKKIIIDDDYTWPQNLRESFSMAYYEQVKQIESVLSATYTDLFSDDMPVSPSSPIQPREFVGKPLNDAMRSTLNRYDVESFEFVDVPFDIMAPLVRGDGLLESDDIGGFKILGQPTNRTI